VAGPSPTGLWAANLPHPKCLCHFGALKTRFSGLKFSGGFLKANHILKNRKVTTLARKVKNHTCEKGIFVFRLSPFMLCRINLTVSQSGIDFQGDYDSASSTSNDKRYNAASSGFCIAAGAP